MAGNDLFDSFDLDSFDFGNFDSLDTGMQPQQQPVETPDVVNIVTSLRKRAMVVFFVIDISGSMRGARIGAVNDAIRNVLPELKKRERGNTSAEIQIAVLEFSTKANWRTFSPVPVSDYRYDDIENVGGGTNYSTAFRALNEKLSRKQFLNAAAGSYTPLIIFMTDGKPSDMGLYHEELEKLKRNKWFQYSTRAGIAIEEGALSRENENNVYEAKNTVILAKQIELVTLTGVDFVTQQGSIQNSSAPAPVNTTSNFSSNMTAAPRQTVDLTPNRHIETTPVTSQPAPVNIPAPQQVTETASPTLPLGEIDWENDFNF